MRSLSLILPLAALAACTMAGQDGGDRRARGEAAATLDASGNAYADGAVKTGEAKSCLSIPQLRDSDVRGDRVIDFETAGGQVYRNVLPHDCPSLGFEERFAYKTSLAQLCSTDIITVLNAPGLSRGASCGLGEFQPIRPATR